MTAEDLRERLRAATAGLAFQIGTEREGGSVLGTGDKAELRRFAGESLPLAFWRLVFRKDVEPLIEELAGAEDRRPIELAFATLMKAMALLGPLATARERKELGAVLASTGYSEPRFVRLLRARERALVAEVETAARWCARESEGVGIAWPGTARLILAAFAPEKPFRPDDEGHFQARAYYATAAKSERAKD